MRKIIDQFSNLGDFKESTLIDKHSLYAILNQLFVKNAQNRIVFTDRFDMDILHELWDACPTNSKQQILLEDFALVVIKAQTSLSNRLISIKDKIGYAKSEKIKLQEKLTTAREINNFTIIQHINEKLNRLVCQTNIIAQDLRICERDLAMVTYPFQPMISYEPTQQLQEESLKVENPKFDQQIKKPIHNSRLQVIFWSSVLLFFLQLFVEIEKSNFLNNLVSLGLLAIFILDYLDAKYIRVIMLAVLLSLGLDMTWVGMHAKQWWNPSGPASITAMNDYYLKAVLILSILIIVIKILVLYELQEFKPQTKTIYMIKTCYEYPLILQRDEQYLDPISNFMTRVVQQQQ